jgi:hypothetical protein
MAKNTLTGYIQPVNILCPTGHVMLLEGKGTIKMVATCIDRMCQWYNMKYDVTMPTVELTLRTPDK